MPRGKAKRNVGAYLGKSGPDFKKKKVKVGRKGIAANATNTSFKATSINLPTSRPTRQDGDCMNDRGQTLEEILPKLSHYNTAVKRENLQGLLSLLQLHPTLMHAPSTLLLILERAMPLASDVSGSVRRACIDVLTAITAKVTPEQLAPFMDLVLAHVASAMTKLEQNVRVDSLKFVDVFLAANPALLARHGEGLIDNLMLLISAECQGGSGQTARSLDAGPDSKMASLDARLNVFRRLNKLLALILPAEGPSQAVFAKKSDVAVRITQLNTPTSGAGVYPTLPILSRHAGAVNNTSSSLHEPDALRRFASERVLPLLVATWLEFRPEGDGAVDADASGSLLKGLNVLLSVLERLSQQLHAHYGFEDGVSWCLPLTKHSQHFTNLFPLAQAACIVPNPHARQVSQTQALLAGNLLLASTLLSCSENPNEAAAEVVSYLTDLYSAGQTQDSYLHSWLQDHTVTLAQLVTRCLEMSSSAGMLSLLSTLADYASSCVLGAPVQISLNQQLAGWLQMLASNAEDKALAEQAEADWLLKLPKLLWQLGYNHPDASHTTLKVLNDMLLRQHNLSAELSASLQSKLALFFQAKKKGQVLFGPFIHLPGPVQNLALCTLNTLQPLIPKLQSAVINVLQAQASCETTSLFLSLQRTYLLGSDTRDLETRLDVFVQGALALALGTSSVEEGKQNMVGVNTVKKTKLQTTWHALDQNVAIESLQARLAIAQAVGVCLRRTSFEMNNKQLLSTVATQLENMLTGDVLPGATMAAVVLGVFLELSSVVALTLPRYLVLVPFLAEANSREMLQLCVITSTTAQLEVFQSVVLTQAMSVSWVLDVAKLLLDHQDGMDVTARLKMVLSLNTTADEHATASARQELISLQELYG
eukprot:m.150018 g.150018  ORF g.150018 m.150018 type:complete len:877 (+) comp16305_c0_seq7:132-2762(+)